MRCMNDEDEMPKQQPASRRKKRPKNCTFCRNHNRVVSKTGHYCKYRHCQCLLCQLTSKSQMVMKYQQALWRHQSRLLADHIDPLMRKFAKKRSQLCDKCRNHNIFCEKRGHKTRCERESCRCVLCQLTDKRRLIMKYQQRVRRANVTAEEIPSGEENSDTEQSEPNSERECDQSLETTENPMNVGQGVTQLLDSISVMIDDFSRQFPTLKGKTETPDDLTPASQELTQVTSLPKPSTSTHQQITYHDRTNHLPLHPPLACTSDPNWSSFRSWDTNVDINSTNGFFPSIRHSQVRESFRDGPFSKMPVQDYWRTRTRPPSHPFIRSPPVPQHHPFQRPQLASLASLPPPLYPPTFNTFPTFRMPPQPAEKLLLCADSSYHVWKRQYHSRNLARICESMVRSNGCLPVDTRCRLSERPL